MAWAKRRRRPHEKGRRVRVSNRIIHVGVVEHHDSKTRDRIVAFHAGLAQIFPRQPNPVLAHALHGHPKQNTRDLGFRPCAAPFSARHHRRLAITPTCFIVNPAAGQGRGAKCLAWLEERLANHPGCLVVRTEAPGDGVRLAKNAIMSGFERVCAAGGDGTLNEVANGIAGERGVALAVLPAGSANDWARTIGVSPDWSLALETAVKGTAVPADLGRVVGERYFLNICGAGFDASVLVNMERLKHVQDRVGVAPAYWWSIATTFGGFRPFHARIELDGIWRDVPNALLVAVGNAQFYGGGMRMLPDAQIDDGLLDLAWGSDLNAFELALLVRRIYRGAHLSHRKTDSARSRIVRLEADRPVAYHIDGDLAGHLPATYEIVPGAIRVVIPERGVEIPGRSAFSRVPKSAAPSPSQI